MVPTVVTCDTMRDGLVAATKKVLKYGAPVSPRQMMTRELEGFQLVLTRPWESIPTAVNRAGLNPAIGFAEGLQLVAGVSDPQLLARIAPKFQDLMSSNGALHGAYGPRIDVRRVIRLLANEPETRQAVLTIFESASDVWPYSSGRPKDIPCTIALHFMLRNDALNLHVHMRSNDVWLGLPYDVMQFTMLQISVANALHVEPGIYYHHADSLHLYERDVEAASRLTYLRTREEYEAAQLRFGMWTGVGWKGLSYEEIQHRALRLLDGHLPRDPTPTEKLVHDALKRYMAVSDPVVT